MMSLRLLPVLFLVGATALSAQVPNAAAKRAATNAANAANAQLSKQTGQAVPQKAGPSPQAPAKSATQTPAAQTTAKPATQAPGSAAAPTPGTVVQSGAPAADSAKAAQPVAPPSALGKDSALIMREAFAYEPDGRRDPFVSLMTTNDLRPTLSDLRLTSVLFDHSGRRPVAVLRDSIAGVQWRVTTGMSLGRMRVQDIRPKVIVFTIEEFGFSRQDSLVLGDTTRARARSR